MSGLGGGVGVGRGECEGIDEVPGVALWHPSGVLALWGRLPRVLPGATVLSIPPGCWEGEEGMENGKARCVEIEGRVRGVLRD